MPLYRLHDTVGEDLGLYEHPAANVEPGDVVHLSDGREGLVTARVDVMNERVWALLEVFVAPTSPSLPTWRAVEFPAQRRSGW